VGAQVAARSAALLVAVTLGVCVESAAAGATGSETTLSLAAQAGRQLFFDKRLSASGKMACATCHDPEHAYGPPNDLAVQPGGPKLSDAGTRAVPSLRYQEFTPPYEDLLDNPDGISTPGPGGGYTQDGRAPTLADQARIPLLAPNEMANRSPADVVRKIRAAEYAALFRQAFGERIFDDRRKAFRKALEALQAFQMEDPSFHPYSSKYDLYAGNKLGGTLTPAEQRGFEVYNDPGRGNCFACHYNGAGLNGSVRMFTDYAYAAIGVPRNRDIPANKNPKHYDLGICGRPDHPLPASAQYCGMFKTPTLRNVAARKAFFHNGAMKSLDEVIRFYNTRDTNPEKWYPVVDGVLQKFDDLPPRYRGNIDTQGPLDGRPSGSKPAMSEQDIADLIAFLGTLTDDYPSYASLRPALERYLADNGELCLGKPAWPIEVTERDRLAGTRDAVQMPVLEKLGIAVSSGGAVTRYDLTEKGRPFYQAKRKDFCAGKLSLHAIVGWDAPKTVNGQLETTLTYTYTIAPADWVRDPAVQKVFPMVDRVVKGERSMQLQQVFRRTKDGWAAVKS
jgi:cytochrome c peroxidase